MADGLSLNKRNSELPKRWFFTDDVRVPDPVRTIESLDPQIGIIIRNRNYDTAKTIADVCQLQNRVFLIKNHLEIAQRVGANGLHLSERMLNDFSPTPNIEFITAACHTKDALIKAQSLGVDGVFISPIFTTDSHPDKAALNEHEVIKILDGLKPSLKKLNIFALGGMTEKRFQHLKENPHFKPFSGYGAIGDFLVKG